MFLRLLIFSLFLLFSCNSSINESVLVRNVGEAQGTYYHIQYLSPSGVDYQCQIDSILAEVDSSVSLYVPYSIISSVNNQKKIKTDSIFNQLYDLAYQVYIDTDSSFDCTVAPLVDYWGFYRDVDSLDFDIDSNNVTDILEKVGMNKTVFLDTTVLLEEGVKLDFNALAQGFSVDIIAQYLDEKGLENYLIELGGELKSKGFNADNKYWIVGVDKPVDTISNINRFQFVLNLKDEALATSGNYRKFYIRDGVRYSHTINPRTGFPVQNRLLSVTVIANECSVADAYATAFMVMGVESSIELINKSEYQLDVYMVYTDSKQEWKTYISSGMQKRIINL